MLETKWRYFFGFRLHALCGRFDCVFAGRIAVRPTVIRLRREQAAQQVCCLVVLLGDDVRVLAECDAGVGVPEARLDGLHVHAVGEKLRGLGVAKLVELQAVEAVLLAPSPPPVVERVDAVPAARVRAARRGLSRLLHADLGELGGLALLPRHEV